MLECWNSYLRYFRGSLSRRSEVMPKDDDFNVTSSSAPSAQVLATSVTAPTTAKCPNAVGTEKAGTSQDLAMLEYGGDDDALLATEDSVDIEPAADSGAVDHVAGPKHIPGSTLVVTTADTRDFRSANNGVIKNHGEATIELEQDGGPTMSSTVQVADVSRPLHSVGKICDGPREGQEKEMLFMKGEAVVVPAGTFSRLLASVTPIVRYKRTGGLYVAKMRAKTKTATSFTRPGPGR